MGLFTGKSYGNIIRIQEASYNWDTEDPFVFAVHHYDLYPRGNDIQAPPLEEIKHRTLGNDYEKVGGYRMYKGKVTPGFPLHSHWGYETITYVSEGYIDHFDSMGNQGRFGFGDMQWITASSMYSHCEMYPLAYMDRDNPQNVTQICLNLPLQNKNGPNEVRTIWENEIPVIEGEGWRAYVLVGEFRGARGPTPNESSWSRDPQHHIRIVRITLEPSASITLNPCDAEHRNVYVTEEDVVIEGKEIHRLSRVKLRTDQEQKIEALEKKTDIWLLEGDGIGEKQKSYGPIILGSDSEVRKSLNVLRETQEENWKWNFVNKKQPVGTKRFFLSADGTRSEPVRDAPGEHELPPLLSENEREKN